jgi:hypothetical protein
MSGSSDDSIGDGQPPGQPPRIRVSSILGDDASELSTDLASHHSEGIGIQQQALQSAAIDQQRQELATLRSQLMAESRQQTEDYEAQKRQNEAQLAQQKAAFDQAFKLRTFELEAKAAAALAAALTPPKLQQTKSCSDPWHCRY